jgi:hypothetical protein
MQIQESMGALVDAGVVKLAQDDNWLTVELSSGLLFNSGSAFLGTMPPLCSIRFQVFSNRSITMSGCGATRITNR